MSSIESRLYLATRMMLDIAQCRRRWSDRVAGDQWRV